MEIKCNRCGYIGELSRNISGLCPNCDFPVDIIGEEQKHGIGFCEKWPHSGGGYLHDEKDDAPYSVDGVNYCGRCHHYL